MKTNEPGNHDEALRKVLKEWRTDASLPPRFQEGVWRRIERAQAPAAPSVWATIAHWIGTVLPRPALAAGGVPLERRRVQARLRPPCSLSASVPGDVPTNRRPECAAEKAPCGGDK